MFKGHQSSLAIAAFFLATSLGVASAAPVISEIVASNKSTLADADGEYSDWIELHNPDASPIDLDGWYLTDSASNKTKWKIPAVTIPAQGYLVIFASDKDRRDPGAELHTNFALSADGEYLGLVQADGVTVASEFAPSFPPQSADVAYGLGNNEDGTPSRVGYLNRATPGESNSGIGLRERVQITPSSRTFTDPLVVTLEGAEADQIIRYELIASSPRGAESTGPSLNSTPYTGPIAIGSSTLIQAAVFSADGLSQSPISTAHFVQMENAGDAATSTFSSRLPIILLDDLGFGPLEQAQGKVPARLQIFTPGSGETATLMDAPSLATPGEMSVRGSSSALFPKKSYSIELHDDRGEDRAVPLLGLADASDWALVSPWSFDLSYVRNAYVYALSNRIGHWAPHTRFVEVFFKTDGDALAMNHYAGLSVLTERIKIAKDLVAITPLDPSDTSPSTITGGYILKFDPKDEDEFGWITDRGFPRDEDVASGTMLVVDSPKVDKLAPAQRDYIRGYVQDFENALFADRDSGWATHRYLDFIDRETWIDFHLFQVLTKNSDGLARSAYFTKDRDGKLRAGPVWDFDRAMGSTDPRSDRWNEWNAQGQASSFWEHGWWGVLTHDPDFMQAWIDRWQQLRGDAFSSENLVELATTLGAEIDPAAAARDAARWPENAARGGGSFLGEVDWLARWLMGRTQWIDQQFVARPVEITADGARRVVAPDGLQIAYTLDGSDPRAPGGALAPGAVLVSGPLVIGVGNYTLRIYNPNAAREFPGSPWSAPTVIVSDENGSAPPPPAAPQLINLSTRGIVDRERPLVAGLAVGAGNPRHYLIRGIGPTLGVFNVENALPDPVLRIIGGNGTEVARNSDWRTNPNRDEFSRAAASAGAFALSESNRDAAVIVSLPAGNYTIDISSETGKRGTALAEVYALDDASVVGNLSTLGSFRPGDILIGGVSLTGTERRRLLFRAIGPSLAQFGVTNALADPSLLVYSGSTLIAANDDWTFAGNASEIATAAASSGAFPLEPGAKDAAILIEVDPGSYTLQVQGDDNGGTTLLEVYNVP